jgi:hypothetical protein
MFVAGLQAGPAASAFSATFEFARTAARRRQARRIDADTRCTFVLRAPRPNPMD